MITFYLFLISGFIFPGKLDMNNPAFESNGSVSDGDAISPIENVETSLTENLETSLTETLETSLTENRDTSLTLLIGNSTSMSDLMVTSESSRATSRRPSAFLSVDNISDLNSHTYVYDSTRSLNRMTVSRFSICFRCSTFTIKIIWPKKSE